VAVWDFGDQPLAARCPATQSRQIGAGSGFFDEDQAIGIELGLTLRPRDTRRGDVRPILLGSVHAFFEADAVAVEEPLDRADPSLLLALIQQTALDLL